MSSDTLLNSIEVFLARTGLSATRFGVMAAGDTKFVKTLRAGRQARPKTEKAVRDWMAGYIKRGR